MRTSRTSRRLRRAAERGDRPGARGRRGGRSGGMGSRGSPGRRSRRGGPIRQHPRDRLRLEAGRQRHVPPDVLHAARPDVGSLSRSKAWDRPASRNSTAGSGSSCSAGRNPGNKLSATEADSGNLKPLCAAGSAAGSRMAPAQGRAVQLGSCLPDSKIPANRAVLRIGVKDSREKSGPRGNKLRNRVKSGASLPRRGLRAVVRTQFHFQDIDHPQTLLVGKRQPYELSRTNSLTPCGPTCLTGRVGPVGRRSRQGNSRTIARRTGGGGAGIRVKRLALHLPPAGFHPEPPH